MAPDRVLDVWLRGALPVRVHAGAERHRGCECRAYYWRAWAAQQRGALEGYADLTPPSIAVAKGYRKQHGFEYLGPLTDPSRRDDPHRTRCNYCGRIAAQRLRLTAA